MGLQHPDASVRQISVDFLGLVAAHLFKDGLSAADNQTWLAQFASPEGSLNRVGIGPNLWLPDLGGLTSDEEMLHVINQNTLCLLAICSVRLLHRSCKKLHLQCMFPAA